MTTTAIIGQIIKQKHPTYNRVDNEKLGQSYVQKFHLKGIVQGVQDVGNSLLETAQNILSAKGPITQAFGNYNPAIEKYSNGINTGVDIGVPTGTKVATPAGKWKVVESKSGDFNRGYGNSVLIQNVDTGEKLRFSHLNKILGLQAGQEIGGNQVFGETGATGNVTGPHLDLEYYDKLGKLGDVLKTAYGRGLNG